MKIISMLMLSSLFGLAGHAADTNGKLISLTLEDGREVSTSTDVKEILTGSEDRIDRIELVTGEIYYDTEIQKVKLRLTNKEEVETALSDVRLYKRAVRVMRVGGDGSGGG